MAVSELKADLDRAVMQADRAQVMLLSHLVEQINQLEVRIRDLETRQDPERYLDVPGGMA